MGVEAIGVPFVVRRPLIRIVVNVVAFGVGFKAVRAWLGILGSDSDQRRQP